MFPLMPPMPAFPNLSAGGGGPSRVDTSAGLSGGINDAGWVVQLGTAASSAGVPHSATYSPDGFGLPNFSAIPGASAAAAPILGSTLTMSPALMLVAAVAVFMLLRK